MRMVLLLLFSIALGSSNFANAQNCAALPNNLTNGNTADASQVMANFNSLLSCINNNTTAPPMGRLTLVTGTPVMNTTPSPASSIIYTPAVGSSVPVWNGTTFVATPFVEVSQALSDATKSPSAAIANNVYDLFVWSDAGTIRITRGPAWTAPAGPGATSRGTGTGTTELTRVNGLLVNANAITNGPAAFYGVYVGTIATDASGPTVSFQLASQVSSGGVANIGLWNAYNRHSVSSAISNSNGSWTVLSSTPREVQGGPFRTRFVTGLAEDGIMASYQVWVSPSQAVNSLGRIGVSLDQTTQFDRIALFFNSGTNLNFTSPIANNSYPPQLGLHFIAALEVSDNVNSQTFYGGFNNSNILAVTLYY